jgi:hypothetical protein
MTPDRMRTFMMKFPQLGRECRLVAEQGLSATSIVQSWTRDILDAARDPKPDEEVPFEECLAAAQNYTDTAGEPTRFQVQWLNARDHIIKSEVHNCAPKSSAKAGDTAIGNEPISANRIVQALLSAFLEKDKTLAAAMGTVLGAYKEALVMQQNVIHSLTSEREHLRALQPTVIPKTDAEIEAELSVLRMKGEAWGKFAEHGPNVVNMLMTAAAKQMGLLESTAGAANGVAAVTNGVGTSPH